MCIFVVINLKNNHYMADIIIPNTNNLLPDGYEAWRNAIETRIERAKLHSRIIYILQPNIEKL